MMVRGLRTVALAAAPVALITAGATPAAAGQTERFSYDECVEWEEDGTRLCFQGSGRVHIAMTKSGNENLTLRAQFAEQLYGPGGELLATWSSTDKAHSLVKKGEQHVFTLKGEGVMSDEGGTCPFSVHIHYVKGEVRVERVDFACEI